MTGHANLYNCKDLFEGDTRIITEVQVLSMARWLVPHAGLSIRVGSSWYSIAESPEYLSFGATSSYWCQADEMPMHNFKANGYLSSNHMGFVYWDACFAASGSFITLGRLYDLLLDWSRKKTMWSSLRYIANDCNDYTSPSTNCMYTSTYLFREITNSTLAEHRIPGKSMFDVCRWGMEPTCLGAAPTASNARTSTFVV